MVEVKISKDNVEFVRLKRKEVEHLSFVNFVLLDKGDCFERYHTIKNYYLFEENYYLDYGILYKY